MQELNYAAHTPERSWPVNPDIPCTGHWFGSARIFRQVRLHGIFAGRAGPVESLFTFTATLAASGQSNIALRIPLKSTQEQRKSFPSGISVND